MQWTKLQILQKKHIERVTESSVPICAGACWLSKLLTPAQVNKTNKIGPWDQNQSINQYDLETLGPLSYFLQIVLFLVESKILIVFLPQDHISIFHIVLVHGKKPKILKWKQTLVHRGEDKGEKQTNKQLMEVKYKKKCVLAENFLVGKKP